MTTPIIEVQGVSKRFAREPDLAAKLAGLVGAGPKREVVHALDHVDLAVRPGEVLGLVGESGSGKSTLGRIVSGIWSQSEGLVRFEGRDRAKLAGAERRAAELAVQMVFQDPMSSLNPRMRVEDIISEAPVYHGIVDKAGAEDYLTDLMRKVGLDPAYAKRYPHQFSGGQRARIGIARALAVKPKMIVADESVAALDVSIQAQVLNLFMQLRADFGLTYLFISHDLGVVRHVADRVAILYLGRIVELAPAEDLFARPNHPYTQALLAEVPRVDMGKRQFKPIEGEIPSPLHPPPGCHFHPRCPHAMARCKTEVPALREIAPDRLSACHLNG
ncbi:ABC transporter ATP-binding protein [Phreatobacter stygius]|uniref:ATP-binding cassette domain-containing protein n=3 Tax=Pseudomonadota TaxID=1224 RepID=A0A4D7BBN6_9HYPH|nr:oligopeptide/dipeptide ABC transporter ATP-binding protein [Phreatobacter stygius]QCI65447.1 ATP-binding cassette domain-containing protein [Phreatobacter stygius]